MCLAVGSVIFLVWYLLIQTPVAVIEDTPPPQTGQSTFPLGTTDVREEEILHTPGTIASVRDEAISDAPVIQNTSAKEIATDFYQMTGDTTQYEVSYDRQSGMFTITLYGEDTKKSRVSAEAYILKALPYSKEAWCNFVVTVITNAYENPTWAGRNLGLSFCPNSVVIP